jgi:hypothetical protein
VRQKNRPGGNETPRRGCVRRAQQRAPERQSYHRPRRLQYAPSGRPGTISAFAIWSIVSVPHIPARKAKLRRPRRITPQRRAVSLCADLKMPLHRNARTSELDGHAAIGKLSDHFTAGSSQLMHWRTVRPEMVTTGTIRFSQFGQRVVRSMRSSRFPPNRELELLFHLSGTAKTGGCHGSCSGHAMFSASSRRPINPPISAARQRRSNRTFLPESIHGGGLRGRHKS